MYIEVLIKDMVKTGGALVLSSECTEMEIADAQATGRFAVFPAMGDGFGFGIVRRPQAWLDRVRKLEAEARARSDAGGGIERKTTFDPR